MLKRTTYYYQGNSAQRTEKIPDSALSALEQEIAASKPELNIRCSFDPVIDIVYADDYMENRYNPYHDEMGRFTSAPGGLTSGGESGIIVSANKQEATDEGQRLGRNKATTVNKTYIESGDYRKKFDRISENPDLNRTLYYCSKEALKHRSGTLYEDMYFIDGRTGKVVASITDSKHENQIEYNNNVKSVVSKYKSKDIGLVVLHTHPSSMPPSIDDFNSCYIHGYSLGIIACHNGRVFAYTSRGTVSSKLYELYIYDYKGQGLNEFDAQINALNEIKSDFKIDFREV